MVNLVTTWVRRGVLVTALASLTSCALDQEDTLRADLSRWLHLGETRYFQSQTSCTAAVFALTEPEFKEERPAPAASVATALRRIEANEPVRFVMVGRSPDQISQALMSADLARGLGVLSSGVGPALSCLEDWVSSGVYHVLTSPEAQLVYDPSENALLLVYPPDPLAIYLRGNV